MAGDEPDNTPTGAIAITAVMGADGQPITAISVKQDQPADAAGRS
jgi:hypothetical protein